MLARSGFASACQHATPFELRFSARSLSGDVLRIYISSPEDERGQEQEYECDEGYAAKVCPVYAVLDGRTVVVEDGERPPVFEVFRSPAYGVYQVHAEEQEGGDGYGETPAVEGCRA